jgi:hypothetical protein
MVCNCTSDPQKKVIVSQHRIDTIRKDIPRLLDGSLNAQYLLKDRAEKKAGFQTMENGFDSLKVRFWFGYVFSEKEQVIEIEFVNNKWICTLFNLTNVYDSNYDSVVSIKKEVSNLIPKCGWTKFTTELFNLDVLTLPSWESIPNYTLDNDASSINVQVATKNMYRIYFYPSPSSNEEIMEAKKINKIIRLLQHELGFKPIRNI